MNQTIFLIINNFVWIVFLYLIYKDLRKGLSSPKLDVIVNLYDDKKKVKSVVTNFPSEPLKKEEVVEHTGNFESLSNVPFSDVVASLEKEIKDNKKKK